LEPSSRASAETDPAVIRIFRSAILLPA